MRSLSRWNLFLTILLFTSFSRTSSTANTYFVAENGDDSNPGTEGEPRRTIQKAANTLVEGDSVFIREGIYNERVLPQNSGSPGNEITYIAAPGESVTVDGTGIFVPLWAGLFHIQEKSYLTISGIRFTNSADAGIFADLSDHLTIEKNYTYNTVSSGIGVWGCENIVIDSNEVVLACNDGAQECISVAITDSFEVKNNHVHDGGPGTFGGEGIDLKNGSSNGVVHHNHVHHVNRVGIYVDAWDRHTYNIEVFQNVVHDCGADGMDVASEVGGLLENVRFYDNIVFNNQWVGLTVARWGEPAPQRPMKNVQILNNTFFNNGYPTWGGGILIENPDAESVVVRNNIVSDNNYFQISFDSVFPGNITVDNNLIDGFRGESGEIYGQDSVIGDPLFVNPSGGDFHLLSTSPAIDTGSPVDAPPFDFDGNPRPQGGGFDIGAFEFGIMGMEEDREEGLSIFYLEQNNPNPFHHFTLIRYTLPVDRGQGSGISEPIQVSLMIYDLTGRLVKTLVNGSYEKGVYGVQWEGLDSQGKRIPSGIYFYRLSAKGENESFLSTRTMKMILLH